MNVLPNDQILQSLKSERIDRFFCFFFFPTCRRNLQISGKKSQTSNEVVRLNQQMRSKKHPNSNSSTATEICKRCQYLPGEQTIMMLKCQLWKQYVKNAEQNFPTVHFVLWSAAHAQQCTSSPRVAATSAEISTSLSMVIVSELNWGHTAQFNLLSPIIIYIE